MQHTRRPRVSNKACLKSDIPQVVPLLEYFDATYVSGAFRCSQMPSATSQAAPTLRLRRQQPIFPHECWNVNAATLNDQARTNNICESWNNVFRYIVGHVHPCVWTSIESIRKDQSMCSSMLYQHEIGQPVATRSRKSAQNLQERLKSLCVEYRDGSRTVGEFLRAIGHCIRIY
jgi:hypothetical protein